MAGPQTEFSSFQELGRECWRVGQDVARSRVRVLAELQAGRETADA